MPSPLSRIIIAHDLTACHLIRQAVFTQECGLAPHLERDALDAASLHLLTLSLHDEAIATARLTFHTPPFGECQLSRIAVVRGFRGLGYGKAIVRKAIALAQQRGATLLWMEAHADQLPRWQSMGFSEQPPVGVAVKSAALPHTHTLYLDLRPSSR